uniref:Uncharacterized protein n=1 Tax=Parascaris univalens TaxID=6257 RepID=A0A915A1H7_PARUN
MGQCVMVLADVPGYMPQLLAFILALIVFVGISIAYAIREFHRTKTFYGREDVDDIPEEEKMARMGDLMGNNTEEMHIVQSAEALGERESGSAATPTAAGVKVMMRKRKHPNKATSGELAESPAVTPGRLNIHFTLDVDKTARGFEFIDLLEGSLKETDEFRDIKHKLGEDAEDRLCEYLVCKLRNILEESTTDKWIVHAVIQDRIWKVNGQENLLECGDIKAEQMLRLSASGPTTPIIMMAYKIEVEVHKSRRSALTQSLRYSQKARNRRRAAESVTQIDARTPGKPLLSPTNEPIPLVDVTPPNVLQGVVIPMESQKAVPPIPQVVATTKTAISNTSKKIGPGTPRGSTPSTAIRTAMTQAFSTTRPVTEQPRTPRHSRSLYDPVCSPHFHASKRC